MNNDQPPPKGISRREAMKTALKVGAYAAPVILSVSTARPASAQTTGPGATLTGTITEAVPPVVTGADPGDPLSGALVRVGGVDGPTATTNPAGGYTISNPPTGPQQVAVSRSGYESRTAVVNIAPVGVTEYSTSLTRLAEDRRDP